MRKIIIYIFSLVFLYYVIGCLINPHVFQKSIDHFSAIETTIEVVDETLRYEMANQINDRCTWIQIHLDDFVYKEGNLYCDYIYGNHVVRRSFELQIEGNLHKENVSFLLYYDDSGDLINASISPYSGDEFTVYFHNNKAFYLADGPVNGYYEMVAEAIKGNEKFDFISKNITICAEHAYK